MDRQTPQPATDRILWSALLPLRLYVSNLFHPSAGRPATGAARPLFDFAIFVLDTVAGAKEEGFGEKYVQREQRYILSLLPFVSICAVECSIYWFGRLYEHCHLPVGRSQ